MKVLVTGGAGFIGSHTAVELQQKGFEIVIIDNLNNSRIEVISSIESITGKRPVFYQADCCDLITLQKIFETENIDAVIHFAAHKAVGESVEHPLMYYRNNFVSLLNLLDCCKKYGTQDRKSTRLNSSHRT